MEVTHRAKSRKVQVVYYLCRNRQLQQPHFIEIALVSPDGLYLRDVINKLNFLRGRGITSMYSWSCKRSYKNAFVWNDLCEDDLIVPAHENEYVLKGSELVEEKNSGHFAPARNIKSQTLQQLAAPSSTNIIGRQTNICQDDDSMRSTYRIYKCAHGLADASTQTDEHVKAQETCTRSFLTDNGAVEPSINISLPSSYGACSSAGKTNTLESLMKADENCQQTSEKLEEQEEAEAEEEEYQVSTNKKVRASGMLLQLISCGSNSSEDRDFSQVLSYNSRTTDSRPSSSVFSSSAMLDELECVPENPKFSGLRLEDKQYFSGSLVETKIPNKEEISSLNQSSSNSANRINKCASTWTCTKCMPRSIMGSLSKHPRISSVRFSEDPNSYILSPLISKKPSKRIKTFKDNKENVIKIEERLASGARVIIHLESNDGPSFAR